MLTRDDAPWIDYLEIDEESNERKLSNDAPDDVKKAYEEHQKKVREHINNGTMIPK